jgi:hypothetical protein
VNPVDGLTYWFDAAIQTWKAIGRTDIPLVPDTGSGYGTDTYGERPYGE